MLFRSNEISFPLTNDFKTVLIWMPELNTLDISSPGEELVASQEGPIGRHRNGCVWAFVQMVMERRVL
jgi:hypothetical protein